MTRHVLLALAAAALLGAGACSSPETPEASAPPPAPPATAPVTVHIALPEDASPALEGWAQAFHTAVTTGEGSLSFATHPEAALVVVRMDEVEENAEVTPEPEGEGHKVWLALPADMEGELRLPSDAPTELRRLGVIRSLGLSRYALPSGETVIFDVPGA